MRRPIAKSMRLIPTIWLSSTPNIAVEAPKVITTDIPGACILSAASCSGELVLAIDGAPNTPVVTIDTPTYSSIATAIVIITALGIVFRGLRTSSANVAIRAYPVKAKNKIAADSAIPFHPNGAKGMKFVLSTLGIPPTTKYSNSRTYYR